MVKTKTITIKIISIDKDKITGQEIIGGNKGDDENYDKNNIVEIPMNKNVYLGLLAEMKKANIPMDDKLKCFVGKTFTIVEAEWKKPPKVTLRKDIEQLYENSK